MRRPFPMRWLGVCPGVALILSGSATNLLAPTLPMMWLGLGIAALGALLLIPALHWAIEATP